MTATLSYDVHGPAPVTGTPLVLIGSLGSDRSMWDHQVRSLSGHATVVTVDLRGHGDSEVVPGPCTIDDLADDVLALLDGLGVARVHLAGLSIGGALAQSIALRHPDRAATLTLMSTAAAFGEPDRWIERAALVRSDGTRAVVDTVVANWLTPEFAGREPDVADTLHSMVRATSDEGYAACCQALSTWDSRERLASIATPTVVVSAEQDPSTPPEVVRALADAIPGAALVSLSPCAHVSALEQPDLVTAILRSRLDRS